MLSYLHAFHAGNFADVHKHAALVLALSMMQKKKSGIACFDTHAGSGIYDLRSDQARKTAEADSGIKTLWHMRDRLQSEDWRRMLDVLAQFNGQGPELAVYPGSPAWFRHFLRADDDLTLFELHPAESEQLVEWAPAGRVRALRQDGLAGLLQQLPPRQPRLLALIDPSYEIKTDYQEVAATIERAWKKCRHGVYLVWYPLLNSGPQERLKEALQDSGVRKIVCSELHLNRPPERGMTGSGLLVVNPPWGFGERLAAMMAAVAGDHCLDLTTVSRWLVPE